MIAKNLASDTIEKNAKKIREEERRIAKENNLKLREDFEKSKKIEIEKLIEIWKAEKEKEIKELILQIRKETSDRSRAVLKGKIGEQMAPLLEEFYSKYDLADARFIGQPIDYIIFHNLTKYKDEIKKGIPKDERCEIEIIIADIKTGESQLNTEQRRIRDAINDNRVEWDEIRIDIPTNSEDKKSNVEWD